MTIRFVNGRVAEAALLARGENILRVLMEGEADVTEFVRFKEWWVSENCEPALIEFAWQKTAQRPVLSESDYTCSSELAAKLIHLLLSGDSPEGADSSLAASAKDETASCTAAS